MELKGEIAMKWILWPVFVITLAGCNSNPYAGMSESRMKAEPVVIRPAAPVFDIEAPRVVDMAEGVTSKFKVSGRVLTGTPVLTFEDLPKGAVYNEQENEIEWTPPPGAAVDPSNALATTNSYQVKVFLTSSEEMKSRTQKTIVILVHNRAHNVVVNGLDPKTDLFEGVKFEKEIKINNPSYPSGPFVVTAVGAPPGLIITPTQDPTKFKLTYNPSFSVVMINDYQNYCYNGSQSSRCKTYNWTLHVLDRRNFSASFPVIWAVADKRQEPVASVPASIDARGLTAEFYFQVEDPNGESVPTIKEEDVKMGSVTFTAVFANDKPAYGNPNAMMRGVWTGLPKAVVGTKQNLSFKVCSKHSYYDETCVTKSIGVFFPAVAP